MKAIPVNLMQVADDSLLNDYFDIADKWKFDTSLITLVTPENEHFDENCIKLYKKLSEQSHNRRLLSCIYIPSLFIPSDKLGLDEAQYSLSDNPLRVGKNQYIPSFASDRWIRTLKSYVEKFIYDLGYDVLLLEEPAYTADIPGKKDRFYQKFKYLYPDVEYPEKKDFTTQYLTLQKAKGRMLSDYYDTLSEHAKSVGTKKIGLMMSGNSSNGFLKNELSELCSIHPISAQKFDCLDFMTMSDKRVDDSHEIDGLMSDEELLKKYFLEISSYSHNNDVFFSLSVDNGNGKLSEKNFKDRFYASIVASPSGLILNNSNIDEIKDTSIGKYCSEACEYLGRVGPVFSRVAFVVSDMCRISQESGRSAQLLYPDYWMLANELAFDARIPMLVFDADTLKTDLEKHPEVRILIFEEHNPLSTENIKVVSEWLEENERRAILAFGCGDGYCADAQYPGIQPCNKSFPGVLEQIGLKIIEDDFQLDLGCDTALNDVSRIRRSAFLVDLESAAVSCVANVGRIFGSRANVLYDVGFDNEKIPVISEWRTRNTVLMFCGFGINEDNVKYAREAINYLLKEVDCVDGLVEYASDGILWNVSAHNYIVAYNYSDKPGIIKIRRVRCDIWDCVNRQFFDDDITEISIGSGDFKLIRTVGKRSKFIDIIGICGFRKLVDGAGRAEVKFCLAKKATLVLRSVPKEIIVDKSPYEFVAEEINGLCYVKISEFHPGEKEISIRW